MNHKTAVVILLDHEPSIGLARLMAIAHNQDILVVATVNETKERNLTEPEGLRFEFAPKEMWKTASVK